MEQKKKMHYSSDICWNKEGWDGQDIQWKPKYTIKMGVRKTNFVDVDCLWVDKTDCCEYSDWT